MSWTSETSFSLALDDIEWRLYDKTWEDSPMRWNSTTWTPESANIDNWDAEPEVATIWD